MTFFGELQEMMKNCVANSLDVAQHTPNGFFPLGCWSYLGLGCEKKWYGTHVNKPHGECNRAAEIMVVNFTESGHLVFQATSPVGRGELKSKGGGKENHSLQRKWRNGWIDSSHGYFCQSAPYLRSSRRFVQRIRSILCRKYDLRLFGHTARECRRWRHIHLRAQHHRHKETCCKIV